MGVMFQAWRMFVMFLGLQLGAARISTGSIHINSIKLVPTSGLPARVGRHWQRSIRRSFLHQSTCSSLQDRSLSCKNLSQLSHTNILLHLLPIIIINITITISFNLAVVLVSSVASTLVMKWMLRTLAYFMSRLYSAFMSRLYSAASFFSHL